MTKYFKIRLQVSIASLGKPIVIHVMCQISKDRFSVFTKDVSLKLYLYIYSC